MELVMQYRGGVPQLSADTGLSMPTLYAFAAMRHKKPPVRVIRRVAEAMAKVDGGDVEDHRARILDLWWTEWDQRATKE